MRLALVLGGVALLFGCGFTSRPVDASREQPRQPQVVLRGVQLRQYHGTGLTLECRAAEVSLDPDDQSLQATGPVEATLDETLWEKEPR